MDILVVILSLAVLICIIFNVKLNKHAQEGIKAKKEVETLSVLQKFSEAIGQDINVSQKTSKLNYTLIDGFDLQYSSIVTFDGQEYVVKASNIDPNTWDFLSILNTEEEFVESISKMESKYLKVDSETETLKYTSAIQRNIKSAMFLPLYVEETFFGFWFIESEKLNAFDNLEKRNLEIIKTNISSLLQSMSYQEALQSMVTQDKFTGLNSRDYLYSEGKNKLNSHISSAIVMFEITNLVEINETLGREAGNITVSEVANVVNEKITDNEIFVRYFGPKFLIAFPGMQAEEIKDKLDELKTTIESTKIKVAARKNVNANINIACGTYYKGTGLDGISRRLEDKLNNFKEEDLVAII